MPVSNAIRYKLAFLRRRSNNAQGANRSTSSCIVLRTKKSTATSDYETAPGQALL
jgi:hypothetical protein